MKKQVEIELLDFIWPGVHQSCKEADGNGALGFQVFINFVKKQVEIVRDEEEAPQPRERRSWWSGRRQAHSVLESLSSHGSSVGGGGQDKDEPLLGASASSDSLELSDGDDDTLLQLDQADGVSCPFVVELPFCCRVAHQMFAHQVL